MIFVQISVAISVSFAAFFSSWFLNFRILQISVLDNLLFLLIAFPVWSHHFSCGHSSLPTFFWPPYNVIHRAARVVYKFFLKYINNIFHCLNATSSSPWRLLWPSYTSLHLLQSIYISLFELFFRHDKLVLAKSSSCYFSLECYSCLLFLCLAFS